MFKLKVIGSQLTTTTEPETRIRMKILKPVHGQCPSSNKPTTAATNSGHRSASSSASTGTTQPGGSDSGGNRIIAAVRPFRVLDNNHPIDTRLHDQATAVGITSEHSDPPNPSMSSSSLSMEMDLTNELWRRIRYHRRIQTQYQYEAMSENRSGTAAPPAAAAAPDEEPDEGVASPDPRASSRASSNQYHHHHLHHHHNHAQSLPHHLNASSSSSGQPSNSTLNDVQSSSSSTFALHGGTGGGRAPPPRNIPEPLDEEIDQNSSSSQEVTESTTSSSPPPSQPPRPSGSNQHQQSQHFFSGGASSSLSGAGTGPAATSSYKTKDFHDFPGDVDSSEMEAGNGVGGSLGSSSSSKRHRPDTPPTDPGIGHSNQSAHIRGDSGSRLASRSNSGSGSGECDQSEVVTIDDSEPLPPSNPVPPVPQMESIPTAEPKNGNQSSLSTDEAPPPPRKIHAISFGLGGGGAPMGAFGLGPANLLGASPPSFVSVEEIMAAATGVSNMAIAHEIALDQNFKLEPSGGSAGVDSDPTRQQQPEAAAAGLHGRVKEVMHKAYWDILRHQLAESPPNFRQAIALIDEIKNCLKELLLPHHQKMREEIDQVLDCDLIRQQAENGVIDVQRYAQYILSVMSRLCSPARDGKIKELTNTSNVVDLYKGIMETIELMRVDMANFAIQAVRPHIQQQSVEYERNKFEKYLEVQRKSGVDGLEFTRRWIRKSFLDLDLDPAECGLSPATVEVLTTEPIKTSQYVTRVLNHAYLDVLTWDAGHVIFPETLMLDQARFLKFRNEMRILILVGSCLLVTFSNFPTVAQSPVAEFKETLKRHLMTLITDDPLRSEVDKLTSCAIQILSELKTVSGGPMGASAAMATAIDPTRETAFRNQIISLADKETNRVRKVVERRMSDFIESVLATSSAAAAAPLPHNLQIPSGLSTLQKELTSLAGQFLRVVNHNRSVFAEYYHNIVRDLLAANLRTAADAASAAASDASNLN